MEITTRSLWTLIHGMGFGALYLLAGSGAIVLLCLRFSTEAQTNISPRRDRFLGAYLTAMAALAWLTVLSGTYIIYPRPLLRLAPRSLPAFHARFFCRIR